VALALAVTGDARGRDRVNGVRCGPPDGERLNMPNLVLAVLDTTRADAFLMPDRLPGLADLAARGMTFDRALSAAPWTLPSHGSLFSGLLPFHHGLTGELAVADGRLRPVGARIRELGPRWLPLRLQQAGYQTFAASANPWITPRMGWDLGFDSFEETWQDVRSPRWQVDTAPKRRPRTWWLPGPTASAASWARRAAVASSGQRDSGAAQALATFRAWIKRRDPARPYFAFFNFMEAHLPYLPPRPFGPRAVGGRVRAAGLNGRLTNEFVGRYNVGRAELPPEDLGFLAALYREEIRYLDTRLADLAEEIDGTGDAVLAVVGDHGEHLGEHHLLGHQASLADTLLHVPLILVGPQGLVPRAQQREPISTVRVPATLERLAGLSPSGPTLFDRADGIPALAWYESAYAEAAGARELADGELADDPQAQRIFRWRGWAAYLGRHKLVAGADGSRSLFDLEEDPTESTDLAVQAPELLERFADLSLPFRSASGPVPEEGSGDLEDIERHLESLGYL